MIGIAGIADIARHRRNREKQKLTADERGPEEIAKIVEIAKDRRKEELTAKDAKERKGGDARTRSRGSMQSFDGLNSHSIDFTPSSFLSAKERIP
jgi:hypothetical protein